MDPNNATGNLPSEGLQLSNPGVLGNSLGSVSGSNSFQRIPSSNPRPTRELKVEDALLYLDQVKMEFSDKPHIYNEFLDIMKNFKAQSINTPGVIDRVKTLFKGHNKLILGFNTFLPEGEGYKIELNTDDVDGSEPVVTTVKVGLTSTIVDTSEHAAPKTAQANLTSNIPATTGTLLPPFATNPPVAPAVAANLLPAGAAAAATSTSPPPGQMQQAHAFHYVTKIRDRFTNEPETYRSFLKILHTYQKEQKNIKEVLEQVSQLFADHADLLMEFTYFLPDAVQDQAKERLERAARESEARKNAKLQAQKQRKSAGSKVAPAIGLPSLMLGAGMVPGSTGASNVGNNILHGGNSDMNLAGAKRGRNLMEPSAANPAGAAFPANYAMQLAAHGLDESQLHLARLQPASKKQNLGAGLMAGIPANAMGSNLALQQQLQQQQQRKPRRKNAQGGNDNLSGAGMVFDNRNMGDLMVAGNVTGGNKLLGYPASAVNAMSASSQQLLFGHHSQQSYLGLNASGGSSNARGGRSDAGGVSRDTHTSISAERRFFDQIKDVLMANSRDAWAEFVKCLELFTDDKISKDELLKLVEDLLHDHLDLFKEFQRLLENRVDYQSNKEDMWFSVPLSEIDFAQCRKCTPSYRALPRDYPRPKCSERNEEEEKFLNDVWVSIPIGSEESSSFKHMRKNQYEEALFKCEDERFEIDMIIDSNMSTIRVLEPLAEEIGLWKASLGPNRDSKRDGGTLTSPNNPHSALGLGPRFSLQLEKRQLTTIHLNAISRIYGDHGEEILELLRKNPVGTIPVVLKRLKQKDQEWRRARHELNKHWKEVVEKNHYKSFDHRSFYFRQNDKKYLSTKPLVQEIVNSAAAVNSAQQQISSDVANANTSNQKPPVSIMASLAASAAAQQASDNSHNAGVHYSLEDEEYSDLLAGLVPHMLLSYSHEDHLVHRDIYRIVCNATEHILTNPSDKERLAALWRDMLRIFFNIPPHYLYATVSSPSSLLQSVSSSFDLVGTSSHSTVAGEAWPIDTKVLTVYGSGVVKGFREADSIYEVQMSFGRAFVHSTSILGAEQLSTQALYAIGVTIDQQSGKHSIFNGAVSNNGDSTTNSAEKRKKAFVREPSKLFYGTQLCYVLFRLHHALFARLSIARKLAQEISNFDASVKNNDLPQERVDASDSASASKKSVYPTFIGQVHALMEGSIDSNRFEDFCRSILGNKSYVLFTIDKIVHQLIKHLQAMANDDNVNKLIGLFVYHHNRDSEEGVDSVLYKNHVTYILSHTAEEIFRIQLLCPSSGIMAKGSEVAIQHLGMVNQSTSPDLPSIVASAAAVGKGSSKGKRVTEASSSTRKSRSEKAVEEVSEGRNESVEEGEDEAMDEDDAAVTDEGYGGAGDAMDVSQLQDDSRIERTSSRGSGSKAPKAVVSDDDDEEEEEAEDIEDEDSNEANRKVVFSPRIR